MLERTTDVVGGVFDETIKEENLLHNLVVKEVYKKMGPFLIPEVTSLPKGQIIEKGPFRLTNGAIYIGQWSRDLRIRQGKGRQVWIDGSYYEGHWIEGKNHGIGRLIH